MHRPRSTKSCIGTTVFRGKFSQFSGPVCQIPWITTSTENFLWPPETNQICSICRWQLQPTDTVCLANKLAIFQISSAQYFQYSSHYSPSGSHVFHSEIMYTYSTLA